MIKVDVEYTDFNDQKVKETALFHFSQDEMFEFLRENRARISGSMAKAVQTEDYLEAYRFVRDLVIAAYGERSEDGKRFVKNDDVRNSLIETPLMDAVMDKLFEDENTARNFINSLMPPKMRELIEDKLDKE